MVGIQASPGAHPAQREGVCDRREVHGGCSLVGGRSWDKESRRNNRAWAETSNAPGQGQIPPEGPSPKIFFGKWRPQDQLSRTPAPHTWAEGLLSSASSSASPPSCVSWGILSNHSPASFVPPSYIWDPTALPCSGPQGLTAKPAPFTWEHKSPAR